MAATQTLTLPRRRKSVLQRLPSSSMLVGYLLVTLGALVMLMPFWFMFVFATHTNSDILSVPPPMWFGSALPDNLEMLFHRLPFFWHNFAMSLYVSGMTTALNLLFCSMAGYAFAMYEFRYKKVSASADL